MEIKIFFNMLDSSDPGQITIKFKEKTFYGKICYYIPDQHGLFRY